MRHIPLLVGYFHYYFLSTFCCPFHPIWYFGLSSPVSLCYSSSPNSVSSFLDCFPSLSLTCVYPSVTTSLDFPQLHGHRNKCVITNKLHKHIVGLSVAIIILFPYFYPLPFRFMLFSSLLCLTSTLLVSPCLSNKKRADMEIKLLQLVLFRTSIIIPS